MARIVKLTADEGSLHLDFETGKGLHKKVRSLLLVPSEDGVDINVTGLFGQTLLSKQTNNTITIQIK